jgi:hypothetical protein
MGERLLVAAVVSFATVCEILDVVSKVIYDRILRLSTDNTQQG